MRICLVGEGTYPVATGGVSTWYAQLIDGLAEHQFDLVTLVGDHPRPLSVAHSNVDSIELVPMWAIPPRAKVIGRRQQLRTLTDILEAIWAGALPSLADVETDLTAFGGGLRRLTQFTGQPLASLLGHRMSAEVLLSVWRRHAAARPDVPVMTMADAAGAAQHADRILALADHRLPKCDLIHLTANGSAAVPALGHKWRHGAPLLLTEHGVFLRERYLAMSGAGLSWASRCAVMALVRALCRLAYAEADLIAPVSDFNGAWAVELGAPPHRIQTIHNGVDLDTYPPLTTEPDSPTVTWVGRVDPLKDLVTLIDAFDLVRKDHHGAQLRLFGPTSPENRDYRRQLERRINELGLGQQVTFEGPVSSSTEAFQAGQVVALSSISEGLPFSVIEAMMSGRPSVNTDVGGVGEIVGRDGSAGLLVPPRDPVALAAGLSRLLADPQQRSRMGRRARERAAAKFTLAGCIERYQHTYSDVVGSAGDDRLHDQTDQSTRPATSMAV